MKGKGLSYSFVRFEERREETSRKKDQNKTQVKK